MMKIKILAVLALVAIGVISCKEDKKSDSTVVESKEKVNEYFSVEVDATVSKLDNFAAYYTEDGTNKFTGDKAIWSGISASGKPEKVIFKFPQEVIPTLIRLDFGLNKDQGNVVIHKVKMDYYGKSFEFKGSDFFKYFIECPVKAEVEANNGTLTVLRGENGYVTPYYYPRQSLIDSITRITSEQ